VTAAFATQHRTASLERKRATSGIAAVGTAGVFEGYASLFDVADLGRDVVMRGAFRDSLARRGAGGVKMLWQHDAGEPIGTWLSIEEDTRGLKVRGRLNLSVARAREILALMHEGAVDGLSIGFRTQKAAVDRTSGLRRLQAIDLQEISIVTFPMLPQARVTAVKRAAVRHRPARIDSLIDIRRALTALRWERDALVFARALRQPVMPPRF
jgi:HK97 family phage prohead protease